MMSATNLPRTSENPIASQQSCVILEIQDWYTRFGMKNTLYGSKKYLNARIEKKTWEIKLCHEWTTYKRVRQCMQNLYFDLQCLDRLHDWRVSDFVVFQHGSRWPTTITTVRMEHVILRRQLKCTATQRSKVTRRFGNSVLDSHQTINIHAPTMLITRWTFYTDYIHTTNIHTASFRYAYPHIC